jgi:large subunit ribosomal protein L23
MKEIDLMNVLEVPLYSEKSTLSPDANQRIVFRIRKSATKNQVKRAVELMFKVEVESVNTLNVKGKTKRSGRFTGRRSDWKKAYVKLKPGFGIELSVA